MQAVTAWMHGSFAKAAMFTFAVCGIYIYVAYVVTEISGGAKTATTAVKGVNPAAGKALFWGKGKCWTCHSVGKLGSAIRGPNQGNIGFRAIARAKERTAQTGKPYTPSDYLMESHFNPGAYVVKGYKNEMPTVWKPPIGLKPEEILAIDTYFQSLGGTVDVAALRNSRFYAALKRAAGQRKNTVSAWKPYFPGDPKKGKAIFFDTHGKVVCIKCHTVGKQGGHVGPELTHVAATRDARYITESILEPSKVIASGFESYLVVTKRMQFIAGMKRKETHDFVEIMDKQGKLHHITKSDIRRMAAQKTSTMPGNFRDVLTVDEFQNILAFVLTLS